jgi:hypothetical protein
MNVRSVDLTEGGVLIHFSNGTSVSLLPSSSALTGAMTAIGFCPRRASRFASLGQLFGVVQKTSKSLPATPACGGASILSCPRVWPRF